MLKTSAGFPGTHTGFDMSFLSSVYMCMSSPPKNTAAASLRICGGFVMALRMQCDDNGRRPLFTRKRAQVRHLSQPLPTGGGSHYVYWSANDVCDCIESQIVAPCGGLAHTFNVPLEVFSNQQKVAEDMLMGFNILADGISLLCS